MAELQVIKSVAVMTPDGYLVETLAYIKRRGKSPLVRVTFSQRETLCSTRGNKTALVDRVDVEYQGKFPGALPHGYRRADAIDWNTRDRWYNGTSQWFDARELHAFLAPKFEGREATYGEDLFWTALCEVVK